MIHSHSASVVGFNKAYQLIHLRLQVNTFISLGYFHALFQRLENGIKDVYFY